MSLYVFWITASHSVPTFWGKSVCTFHSKFLPSLLRGSLLEPIFPKLTKPISSDRELVQLLVPFEKLQTDRFEKRLLGQLGKLRGEENPGGQNLQAASVNYQWISWSILSFRCSCQRTIQHRTTTLAKSEGTSKLTHHIKMWSSWSIVHIVSLNHSRTIVVIVMN